MKQNILLKLKVEPMLVSLGQLIKKRRLLLGLSQEQLAEIACLNRSYISEVERGCRNLTLGALTLLAEGVGLSISELILAVDRDALSPDHSSKIISFAADHQESIATASNGTLQTQISQAGCP